MHYVTRAPVSNTVSYFAPVSRACCFTAITTMALVGCQPGSLTLIDANADIITNVRAALADDGTVAAAKPTAVIAGDGTTKSTFDLSPSSLQIASNSSGHALRIRNGGEVVLVADHVGATGCPSTARGAYQFLVTGGTVTTYRENCTNDVNSGLIGREIALSPNGTVAFSQIRDGHGAIWTGPSTGPVSVFHSGSGIFYNTLALDVADTGRVAVEMEYTDSAQGRLVRGILVFDSIEQPESTMLTALEKLSIGTQPQVAVNQAGNVAFALNTPITMSIGGTNYTVGAGVYVSTPTLFNTPKSLTLIADLSSKYCAFGSVDINDAGTVVFEATLQGNQGCPATSGTFDGIFSGPDPTKATVVLRGQSHLGDHMNFDAIYLGEVNNAGQVSFITHATGGAQLIPVKVWRWNP